MMIYEAVLFDMDGVVIDTEQAVALFWQRLAARHGVTLTHADWTQHIYGVPALTTLDAVFPMVMADERRAFFEELETYELNQPYIEIPGVTAILRGLKAHGILIAVVTSGDRWKLSEVTRQLDITDVFAASVTVNDITRGKPHPDGYLLAADRLGKAADRCIVFEDSLPGVQAAVAARATCIGVRAPEYEATLIELGASHVIADFAAARVRADGDGLTLEIAPDVSLPLSR